MRCSNTAFYVKLRKLPKNLDTFSSTALVIDTFLENLPQFRDNFLK